MEIGIFGLHRGSSAEPEVLARRARRAEELGFESLWVGDHIALPASGDDSGGNMPHQARLEALLALTFMAATTQRVRLGVGVIILPQRHPPIIFGGQSPAALRRTVLIADGWYGFDLDLEATAKAIADLQDATVRHGRSAERARLEISITPPAGALSLDTARRYAELGVDRLVLQPERMDGSEIDDLMSQFAETLIGRV